ncbi:hypothetical protein [Kitasatospora arboriphila]|uniref:MFS transporter n=1 Tax=Kitasatospora arboriphila TaxID=258052 RepID=A0ABN1U1Q0_9ACTN
MPPTRRPKAVLAVLAGAQFTAVLATPIVNVALPQIRTGVGLSEGGTTRVVIAYGLAFAALLPAGDRAGDRAGDLLGHRRVLIAGRALQGIAAAIAPPRRAPKGTCRGSPPPGPAPGTAPTRRHSAPCSPSTAPTPTSPWASPSAAARRSPAGRPARTA